MVAGRLPDPDAPGEVFITARGAERGSIALGDRLDLRIANPLTGATEHELVTIVGIGTLPVEAVSDETAVAGTVVLSRAFYEEHRDLAVYAVSNVDLAPGADARVELASAIGELGHQLQSARTQEQQSVDQALRPLIIVLVALAVLLFVVTALAAAQVIQRVREGWRPDDRRLRALGMTAGQIIGVELATSLLTAVAAVISAVVVMVVASPLGPVGPLHDLDPGQGATLDLVVAGAGTLAILLTMVLVTLGYSSLRRAPGRPRYKSPSWLVRSVGSPEAVAGLTLALRPGDRRGRVWRGIAAAVAATAVVAVCLTFVTSAIALTETPSRYGFDADLLALNAYGDQSTADLEEAFGERDDVVAATGFITGSYLVEGLAVPGLAATTVRGDVTPTLLSGRSGLTDDEIVLGEDTLESVDAELGDLVSVRLLAPSGTDDEPDNAPVDLRVVGVATFPPVNQTGTDMPRLGIGALVARDAYVQMGGSTDNSPEFTMVRMADGADPAAVIADLPEGFEDRLRITTTWFTDTKPAELLQLDAAMSYLRVARLASFGILLAVVVHACWVRARADRRDLAVLRAVGLHPPAAGLGGRLAGGAARRRRAGAGGAARRHRRPARLHAVRTVAGRGRRGRRSQPAWWPP